MWLFEEAEKKRFQRSSMDWFGGSGGDLRFAGEAKLGSLVTLDPVHQCDLHVDPDEYAVTFGHDSLYP